MDLLLDLFGLAYFANKNKNCQLSFSLFQTSQTGGQQYSDISPFSIPWCVYWMCVSVCLSQILASSFNNGFKCLKLMERVSLLIAGLSHTALAVKKRQGILKWEVSLYHWPPVWLVWNQLYDNWQFLFLFAKQTNPNKSNRSSTVQWIF